MISQVTTPLTVPLGHEAHYVARQFATEQATPQKGKQIYLNTLAVYAVHSYLKWLKVETDLNQGHSWHSGMRTVFNVADLSIPGIGKLECRPVLPGETACELPLEVRRDRIGYVAVQFSERLDKVQLLGFARAVDISNTSEQLLIADLQPLDTLLDFIPPNVIEEPVTPSKMLVNLSSWLQNRFEAGWQTLETLLDIKATDPAFGVRSGEQSREIDANDSVVSISAGKLIDWRMQLADRAVVLNVKVTSRVDEEVNIRLRIYPAGEQTYLPPGLQLILVDESGATRLEAQARSNDNWIQVELSGEPGERFSVKVALENLSIIEDFLI